MTPKALPAADPFISLRLFSHHKNDVLLDDLLQEIAKYPGCCDEIWFATDYGFPALEVHEASAAGRVRSAGKVRAIGMAPSFQLSNCQGHGKVDCLNYAGVSWHTHDGQIQTLPVAESNGTLTVTVPPIAPWCIGFLRIE